MAEPAYCSCPTDGARECLDLRTHGHAPALDMETSERLCGDDECECACHVERDDDDEMADG